MASVKSIFRRCFGTIHQPTLSLAKATIAFRLLRLRGGDVVEASKDKLIEDVLYPLERQRSHALKGSLGFERMVYF